MLINRRSGVSNRYITTDYAAAASMAVDHLVGLGHHSIAFLSGPLMSDNSLLRMKGYRRSLSAHDVPYDDTLVKEAGMSYQDGRRATASLLDDARHFTAIFGGNLLIAVGAMQELQDRGLKIPEQVSIVACHDVPLAEMVRPRMTTVKMPLFELGYETTNALLDMLRTGVEMTPRILPPVGLIIRESTGKAESQAGQRKEAGAHTGLRDHLVNIM
jgi:LacI family transcriptional regulator